MSLPLFAFLDDAPQAGPCRHTRTTTSTVHQRHGETCCNHDETCDDCGLRVASHSWNLTLPAGAKDHATAYPEAA